MEIISRMLESYDRTPVLHAAAPYFSVLRLWVESERKRQSKVGPEHANRLHRDAP